MGAGQVAEAREADVVIECVGQGLSRRRSRDTLILVCPLMRTRTEGISLFGSQPGQVPLHEGKTTISLFVYTYTGNILTYIRS